MKKMGELSRELTELMCATRDGKIQWNIEAQTTEANLPEEKPIEEENGIKWTIDECYVSYCCKYKGKDFCMITYEMIKSAGGRTISSNMVFSPPAGIRFFDLRTLLPYSVEASAVLLNQIHSLWVLLMEMYKADKENVYLNVRAGTLTIEEEA